MRGRVPCAFTCILQSDLTEPLSFIHGIFLNISGMSAKHCALPDARNRVKSRTSKAAVLQDFGSHEGDRC